MSDARDRKPKDLRELTVAHVLGLADCCENCEMEELVRHGDAAAKAALREAEESAALLAQTIAPVQPPPSLKARLMARIRDPHHGGLGAVLKGEKSWRRVRDGIQYRPLYRDPDNGMSTYLLKMEPGAVWPSHRHGGAEQCLILEGDLIHVGHETYRAGDFTYGIAGSVDPALSTREGNLLLIMGWPEADEILA